MYFIQRSKVKSNPKRPATQRADDESVWELVLCLSSHATCHVPRSPQQTSSANVEQACCSGIDSRWIDIERGWRNDASVGV